MVRTYKTVVILGAGPVGLFSAFKILENNFAQNVLVLEKRLTPLRKFEEWGKRTMVVQFHRRFLFSGFPEIINPCPHGVLKESNEVNRMKYNDLDHMSIKNIQSVLLNEIDKRYKDRFFMMKLDGIEYDKGIISVLADEKNIQVPDNLTPEFIVDATGYHSVLMNKVIGIDFEREYEYGSALKITWPTHKLNKIESKEIEFHDCHEKTKFFSEGYSSVAEFSYPANEFSDFFEECGYSINKKSTKISFLKYDTTPYSIKLPPFLKKITGLDREEQLYKRAVDLFTTIREGRLDGISGFDFINYLQGFCWAEADNLALVIRKIISKNITIENVYTGINEERLDLEKIRVIFVPSRAERWLQKNNVKIKMKITSLSENEGGDSVDNLYEVTACAIGDSLASTDFRHGLGINRGFHSAIRLFEDKVDPEKVRCDLVNNGYFSLNIENDENIFNRAISCRDWLISK